ncbi:SMP-30/gluconolactonase/LRE family protein [Shimia sp.]|uniref:SMP-30/gluconolactonase/LRE family protein n=1 Tax=Shimia sp. TaxID=1954381 RepID=UPI003296CF65
MSVVFDDRTCALGEGPLWHPRRSQFFWFDILGKRLMSQKGGAQVSWQFDEYVSAAGWVDEDTLIVASETGLWRFDLATGDKALLVALEADNPVTRSNDGRADPQGGFWIGTMGFDAEPGAGAIYRLYKGELRTVVPNVTISNSICFALDGKTAYYSDTPTRQIMQLALDPETGWPVGTASVFVDLTEDALNPDGAVVDAQGVMWCAQWGAGRVAAYGQDGRLMRAVAFPATQTTCPAFGGDDLTTLFCTSANVGITPEDQASTPEHGMTFMSQGVAKGQEEHRVLL